ncbi:transporter substrate-binding domain-containing protein [Rhizobium miluonense]|uniref:Polar amino acid transport system substrate-binding protein n=1 Tax=Rhizobium miluonense TaxID=411945 RepID=A0A1C3X089_9HYPH|nr:transporter substrate-binding domain-containing protein [Rhizobium miluonense]SCB45546.1 polar amino acid transport system substrate-binding protein [Rhizobium miluonense]
MSFKRIIKAIAAMSVAVASVSIVAPTIASAQTLSEKIKQSGVITIGIYNSAPSGFADANGNIAGIYPDVLATAAASLGVKKIEFQSMDFGALIPSLISRRVDAIGGGMYILPKRCEQVIFANPFISGGAAAVVKAGNPKNLHGYPDLAKPGVTVGNLRNAASITDLIAAGVKEENMPLFQDETSGISALMAGRVDALILSYEAAIKQVKDPNAKGLEVATPFKRLVNGEERINYGSIAFRPEDAEFRDRLNETIAKAVKDGSVAKILAKYDYPAEMVPAEGVTAKSVCGAAYR